MNFSNPKKFFIQPNTGCLSEEDAKRYFSRIGLATAALMLIYYVSSIGVTYLLYALSPSLLENTVVMHAASLLPLYGLALPVFCLILQRLPRGVPSEQALGAGVVLGGFCMCIAMMTLGNTVSQMVVGFFEGMLGRAQENPVAAITENVSPWVNLVFVALIPAVLEELLFRKILCDRLLPLGEGYAVVLSAAIFALVHGNFFQIFYAFPVGLIFAAVYVKTGKIWVTMLYHGAINVFGGVAAPWLLQKVAPSMEESFLAELEGLLAEGNSEALSEMMAPYMLPMLGILLYEGLMLAAVIVGIVYFFRKGRRVRFQAGLLPVPRSARVSSVLLNGGVATALTVFAAIFLLSLY